MFTVKTFQGYEERPSVSITLGHTKSWHHSSLKHGFVPLVAQFHSLKGEIYVPIMAHLCTQVSIRMYIPVQPNMVQNSFQIIFG